MNKELREINGEMFEVTICPTASCRGYYDSDKCTYQDLEDAISFYVEDENVSWSDFTFAEAGYRLRATNFGKEKK
jgi:hypothetical protein